MSHFMLIGGNVCGTWENLATTRSYDPDVWSDKVIKLPPTLHKALHMSVSFSSVSITDGAVVLCGGYEGSTPTKRCRDDAPLCLSSITLCTRNTHFYHQKAVSRPSALELISSNVNGKSKGSLLLQQQASHHRWRSRQQCLSHQLRRNVLGWKMVSNF